MYSQNLELPVSVPTIFFYSGNAKRFFYYTQNTRVIELRNESQMLITNPF